MARKHLAYACLLATFVVAGAMPTSANGADPLPTVPPATLIEDAPSYSPACSKRDDDPGMGGTQVSCKYSCAANNILGIAGNAADPDATASGETDCGGAYAMCETIRNKCRGASEGLTTQAQSKATCYGSSDEFWSSEMTIACVSQGSDPQEVLCRLIEDLCEGGPGVPPTPGGIDLPPTSDKIERLRVLCESVVSTAQDLAGFVLATVNGLQFVALGYSPAEGCSVEVGHL